MLEAVTGAGLAGAAGLNAYIPLLVIGLLDRYTTIIALPDQWHWLARPWSLAALTLLLIIEMVADKVPVLDHVNDVIQTVIRPTAGGLSFGAITSGRTPHFSRPPEFFAHYTWLPVLAGLLIGLAVHAAKATLRPIVNLTTLGVGTPVVSALEDAFSVAIAVAAILVPILVVGLLAAVVIFFVVLWRRRMGARQRSSFSALRP